jgi:HAE1 family hydrophobic/amphiphilic exporter-1
VLSGIIASTCLAVLFVLSLFAVLQGFEERRKARKKVPVPARREVTRRPRSMLLPQ